MSSEPTGCVVTSELPYLEAKWRKAKFKLWTKERERQLIELHGIGLDPAIIAADMGLSEQIVRVRMVRLGLLPSVYRIRPECPDQRREYMRKLMQQRRLDGKVGIWKRKP